MTDLPPIETLGAVSEGAQQVQLNDTIPDYILELLPALERLDTLLERAVTQAADAQESDAAAETLLGLYVNREEVERLLAREPGKPAFQIDENMIGSAADSSRLTWLQRAFDLAPFEVDTIVIALAPELDRRYERVYAYLQDHVSRRWPSVDLVLNLLCPDAAARIERRNIFDPDTPLIYHGLVHLFPEPGAHTSSLLAHALKLDEQIVRFLLHQDSLDDRLTPFCHLIHSVDFLDDLPLDEVLKQSVRDLVSQDWDDPHPLRLYFHGPEGVGRQRAAAALAAELGAPLLVVNLVRLLAANIDFDQALRLIFRYAWFYGAIPYLDGLESLYCEQQSQRHRQLLDRLADDGGLTILAGTQPWIPAARHPLGVVSVAFPLPDVDQRHTCWAAEITTAGFAVDEQTLDTLAGRFRLTPTQIADAAATAAAQKVNRQSLLAAARAQSGHDLAALAQKIDPLYTWDDIILPEDSLTQLREICQRVTHRHQVLNEWGFDRKLSQGKGTNALFAGPSGTGKTMAAEIIAGELGLDLYRIDLAGVVSKYIGETEKNLDRIFAAAENGNAILFFDEADALFGKRSEVRDSHDRYANIEISYLLQKMELYDGLTILATNLRRNLDEAFMRRLAFTVHFPFPDEASRARIWAGIWPEQLPLTDDVDLADLAQRFRLSGGNIKNAALAGAFLAAQDGGVVNATHLLHAVRREYQKMGKTLTSEELEIFQGEVTR
jgi:ATP-dependent 26S proteasome regulatory subunit